MGMQFGIVEELYYLCIVLERTRHLLLVAQCRVFEDTSVVSDTKKQKQSK
jgi:hypothetical protein